MQWGDGFTEIRELHRLGLLPHAPGLLVISSRRGFIPARPGRGVQGTRSSLAPVTFLIKPAEGLQAAGRGMTDCPCRPMIWGVLSPWPEGANDR